MQALSQKQAYIPYRNSKLTFLLKRVLGNQNKALMIVTVNQEEENAQETLCSLNFASRVNTIELGRNKLLKNESNVVLAETVNKTVIIESKTGKHQKKVRRREKGDNRELHHRNRKDKKELRRRDG